MDRHCHAICLPQQKVPYPSSAGWLSTLSHEAAGARRSSPHQPSVWDRTCVRFHQQADVFSDFTFRRLQCEEPGTTSISLLATHESSLACVHGFGIASRTRESPGGTSHIPVGPGRLAMRRPILTSPRWQARGCLWWKALADSGGRRRAHVPHLPGVVIFMFKLQSRQNLEPVHAEGADVALLTGDALSVAVTGQTLIWLDVNRPRCCWAILETGQS